MFYRCTCHPLYDTHMKENNVKIEPLKRNASLETRVSWVLIGRMSLRQSLANVEEAEWAVEVMKSTGKPTVAIAKASLFWPQKSRFPCPN